MAFISLISENWGRTAKTKRDLFLDFCRREWPIFVAAYLLQLVVYSYFFTTIIFTDHTFPNTWLSPYPSYRTTVLARWFADILNYMGGGSGVQSFQMAIATGIQTINGIIFASFLGIKKRLYIFLSTAFICLHPAFLDYYSFTKDHIQFTLGDTLAIMGVLALDRLENRNLAAFSAIVCFLLSIATYQPKSAFIAILLLIWCINGAVGVTAKVEISGSSIKYYVVTFILPAVFVFLAAMIIYFISEKIVLVSPDATYTNINDIGTITYQFALAFREILLDFVFRVDYLPRLLRFMPSIAVGVGFLVLASKAWSRKPLFGVAVVLLAALIPPALHLSSIINAKTWIGAARIMAPQAYCLLFFIASIWLVNWLRWFATALVMIFVYYFAIIASQETGELAMRQIFNVNKINRIVARVENVIGDFELRDFPVVVIGDIKTYTTRGRGSGPTSMRMFKNELYGSKARSEVFSEYRQEQILNFFLGRIGVNILKPTRAQVAAAIASQSGRRPWPASDAVFIDNGVVVIVLQSYRPGIRVTVPNEWFGNWSL